MRSFVYTFASFERERERPLFLTRAIFANVGVATLFFSQIFADGEQIREEEKRTTTTKGDDDITYIPW